jgi:hypothetical protein
MLSQHGHLFIQTVELGFSLIPGALLLLVIAGSRLQCRHLVNLTSDHERTKAHEAAVRVRAFLRVCRRASRRQQLSAITGAIPVSQSPRLVA